MRGYFFSVLRKSLPAAGNRNGTTVNNVGSNGNYWSSTYNSNNNAYNFNFNSSNVNTSNNNNRYNGHSVRLVQDFTLLCFLFCFLSVMSDLLPDLFKAYYDARKNKRFTWPQLNFEMDLETNLIELYQDIVERKYKPSSCICFVVNHPVKREVFASSFRDRVVHHLYFNYVSPIFERDFIYDSYSCRKGKGTFFGINRLEHHIRSCTDNYTKEAYVLKMDIQGYFMSIDRVKLQKEVMRVLDKYWEKKGDGEVKWRDLLDVDLIIYLTKVITQKDPLENCRIKGKKEDWEGLPDSKCLSKSPNGVGLPIGDLTSQLFSNIYLNQLDNFVKRNLHFKHYGRYVDDFYIVDNDKKRLLSAIPLIKEYLESIGLTLHPRKNSLQSVEHKTSFLGASLRPYYWFVSKRTTKNFRKRLSIYENMSTKEYANLDEIRGTMNSYLGYFRHFKMEKWMNMRFKGSPLNDLFLIKSVNNHKFGKLIKKVKERKSKITNAECPRTDIRGKVD